MKIVKEHIDETFQEQSDPVADMGIGKIDLDVVWQDTVVAGIQKWYKFLHDLDLTGKKVTFNDKLDKNNIENKTTIIIKQIKSGHMPYEIFLYDEKQKRYLLNVNGNLIIHT